MSGPFSPQSGSMTPDSVSRMSALDLYEDLLIGEDKDDGNRVYTMQEILEEKNMLEEQNADLLNQLVESKLELQKMTEENRELQHHFDSLLATARVELNRKNMLLQQYLDGRKKSVKQPIDNVAKVLDKAASTKRKKNLPQQLKGSRVSEKELGLRSVESKNQSRQNSSERITRDSRTSRDSSQLVSTTETKSRVQVSSSIVSTSTTSPVDLARAVTRNRKKEIEKQVQVDAQMPLYRPDKSDKTRCPIPKSRHFREEYTNENIVTDVTVTPSKDSCAFYVRNDSRRKVTQRTSSSKKASNSIESLTSDPQPTSFSSQSTYHPDPVATNIQDISGSLLLNASHSTNNYPPDIAITETGPDCDFRASNVIDDIMITGSTKSKKNCEDHSVEKHEVLNKLPKDRQSNTCVEVKISTSHDNERNSSKTVGTVSSASLKKSRSIRTRRSLDEEICQSDVVCKTMNNSTTTKPRSSTAHSRRSDRNSDRQKTIKCINAPKKRSSDTSRLSSDVRQSGLHTRQSQIVNETEPSEKFFPQDTVESKTNRQFDFPESNMNEAMASDKVGSLKTKTDFGERAHARTDAHDGDRNLTSSLYENNQSLVKQSKTAIKIKKLNSSDDQRNSIKTSRGSSDNLGGSRRAPLNSSLDEEVPSKDVVPLHNATKAKRNHKATKTSNSTRSSHDSAPSERLNRNAGNPNKQKSTHPCTPKKRRSHSSQLSPYTQQSGLPSQLTCLLDSISGNALHMTESHKNMHDSSKNYASHDSTVTNINEVETNDRVGDSKIMEHCDERTPRLTGARDKNITTKLCENDQYHLNQYNKSSKFKNSTSNDDQHTFSKTVSLADDFTEPRNVPFHESRDKTIPGQTALPIKNSERIKSLDSTGSSSRPPSRRKTTHYTPFPKINTQTNQLSSGLEQSLVSSKSAFSVPITSNALHITKSHIVNTPNSSKNSPHNTVAEDANKVGGVRDINASETLTVDRVNSSTIFENYENHNQVQTGVESEIPLEGMQSNLSKSKTVISSENILSHKDQQGCTESVVASSEGKTISCDVPNRQSESDVFSTHGELATTVSKIPEKTKVSGSTVRKKNTGRRTSALKKNENTLNGEWGNPITSGSLEKDLPSNTSLSVCASNNLKASRSDTLRTSFPAVEVSSEFLPSVHLVDIKSQNSHFKSNVHVNQKALKNNDSLGSKRKLTHHHEYKNSKKRKTTNNTSETVKHDTKAATPDSKNQLAYCQNSKIDKVPEAYFDPSEEVPIKPYSSSLKDGKADSDALNKDAGSIYSSMSPASPVSEVDKKCRKDLKMVSPLHTLENTNFYSAAVVSLPTTVCQTSTLSDWLASSQATEQRTTEIFSNLSHAQAPISVHASTNDLTVNKTSTSKTNLYQHDEFCHNAALQWLIRLATEDLETIKAKQPAHVSRSRSCSNGNNSGGNAVSSEESALINSYSDPRNLWMASLTKCQERRKEKSKWSS